MVTHQTHVAHNIGNIDTNKDTTGITIFKFN